MTPMENSTAWIWGSNGHILAISEAAPINIIEITHKMKIISNTNTLDGFKHKYFEMQFTQPSISESHI